MPSARGLELHAILTLKFYYLLQAAATYALDGGLRAWLCVWQAESSSLTYHLVIYWRHLKLWAVVRCCFQYSFERQFLRLSSFTLTSQTHTHTCTCNGACKVVNWSLCDFVDHSVCLFLLLHTPFRRFSVSVAIHASPDLALWRRRGVGNQACVISLAATFR